jgi:L-asparaginase
VPHVVVLGTGGTISSRTGADGAAVATDSAASLVSAATADRGLTVEPIDLLRVNSFNLDLADLRSIADAVHDQLARASVDGIVITHGTDTIEETAVLLDLVHADERPVVLTGAQIPPDQDGADGSRNLRQAITVAASAESRDLGVLISFAGEIFAARGLRKLHTLRPQPYAAQNSGPIGRLVQGDLRYLARPIRSAPLPRPTTAFDSTRVETLTLYPGARSDLLSELVRRGAAGLVLAGTGAGNLNRPYVEAVRAAVAAGTVIVLSSRVPHGPISPVYGSGGGADALRAGAVPVRGLPYTQARILLALLLSHYPPDEAAARLERF